LREFEGIDKSKNVAILNEETQSLMKKMGEMRHNYNPYSESIPDIFLCKT